MRTRNAETPKARATKKTPVRKSATKTTPKASSEAPESSTTTPKSADIPISSPLIEPKLSNDNSATATPVTPTTVLEPESKVEDSGPLADTAQATPEIKATPTTKAPAKKSPGKTKTNAAAKVSPTQTPESVVKPEQSVVNVGESSVKGETASPLVVETPSKGESLLAKVGQSLKKEETLEEAAVARVRESPKKEQPVVVNMEEVVKEEVNKEPAAAEDTKEPESDPVSMEGDVEENVGGEDAEPKGDENVADEGMQDLGEQEGLEEPVDEECAEDDMLASDEEAVGLDEEQMEISAVAKERKMKKEQEIFVGGLERDAVEEDVRKAFEKIGDVVEVRLHRNPSTNKNKGYAFVKFADKQQATRALLELKNPVIRGKRCGIAPSEDNDTLFLGNICNTWTKEAIKQKLREYGVEGVENITLVPDAQHEGLSRGFVFLEFSCHADAMLAYKRLQKPDVIFGHAERTAKVAFAEPLREPDPEVMAQVKSVFVDGLPPYWDEDRVKEHFKGYGEIERIMLARNMSTAKRKDFGFVDYTTHEAAVVCVNGVNNTELGDGKSKAKVKARLANPLPKTQAVKGGMRGGFRIGHIGSGAFSRFGRGFGRGGRGFAPMNFQRGRSFYSHGRGRGRTGRFGFSAGGDLGHYSDFHGRQPFGGRGGRRGFFRGTHQTPVEEFVPRAATSSRLDRPRRGAFERGRGKQIQYRRPPFSPEREFGGPFGDRHFVDEPYMYDGGHGLKRPFAMMDQDPLYMEQPSRLRARYDYPDPVVSSRGTHFRDSLGAGGDLYEHDYYGSDYAGGAYSSLYGGDHAFGGGYYY
ncbi:heterogeneous nuclear ribonucleoprotein Q-like isoform X2 [Telopea speciosissima]|uniref:heterogeneous nuclear ribonucleoprotein Q-like isoform X2 n=1 Tax=Telopea speciosissima TaxID=54955 RepID=UPI001CC75B1D|nr:heterogeneous nuclear ribonucleoprotein Q-like isoform X2 [Telopea speciosissima]